MQQFLLCKSQHCSRNLYNIFSLHKVDSSINKNLLCVIYKYIKYIRVRCKTYPKFILRTYCRLKQFVQ